MTAPLVVFGEDWGGLPSSSQHLIRELLTDRTILWVDSIGLRRPRPTAHDLRRLAAKLWAAARRPGPRAAPSASPGGASAPQRIAPLAIPVPTGRLARRCNGWLLAAAVRGAMRRSGVDRPILWISLPTAVDVVGRLGERAVVYYCCDDWRALAGVDHGPVAARERELVEKADVILAASPALAARFPPAKTVIVSHGVDLRHFAEPHPRPADFPAGGGPVAGFFGSVAPWIDLGLIEQAAAALPDWRFLMIGPVRVDPGRLRRLPNVLFAGPKPHADLPGYAQHWDVSLLPFRDTPQIRACNPLKLREYLASGTPIVATDCPALDGYRDLVEVAGSGEAWVAAIRRAGGEGRRRAPLRQDRVAGESWQERGRQVAAILSAF